MLCDVNYEEAKKSIRFSPSRINLAAGSYQIYDAGKKLGHKIDCDGKGVYRRGRLKKVPESDLDMSPWFNVPYHSIVRVVTPKDKPRGYDKYHWVVWDKGKIYDPARGVFKPETYDKEPEGYMEFIR
jgi:hypothetical protein